MTREEAIQLLNQYNLYSPTKQIEEAVDMAIEALSADAVQGVGRYENAMQKLREMPRYLNGVKEKQIKKIPSEAVQVVRCKDCKNWRESYSEDEESYCYIDGRTTDSTGYCSWGERREE